MKQQPTTSYLTKVTFKLQTYSVSGGYLLLSDQCDSPPPPRIGDYGHSGNSGNSGNSGETRN